ncbi:class A beta-lactamase-related serine hydrolase [Streptococcus sp. sy004]|uniref:class A beta-lactamase-related serine hydrolase n=1 Tax=Streptococcus sp. sy004 TaxID=2600149 RepID=UPI0021BDD9FD|nr:class A beta-lactamase-related serine hydrolase [Streptococcus sp. sy004]
MKQKLVLGFGLGFFLALGVVLYTRTSDVTISWSQLFAKKKEVVQTDPVDKIIPTNKSAKAKKAAMAADLATMDGYGLYYDYANLSLEEVVKTYMEEFGIESNAIAFSYKNMKTGETFAMNDTQLMTAGSTYKLPLNMLVVDQVVKGKLSMDKAYDITEINYEYEGEYQAYRAQFGDDMTISEMQEYSLVYSENTPAYALASLLGGVDEAYKDFGRYGQSKSAVKTIQLKGNKTTSDYYIQVLQYLWKNQEKYADILNYLDQSFPGEYYETYLPDIQIYQKPGYVREALNIDAIVMEETPYMIALYTAGLGGADENTEEINPEGYNLLAQLTYVVNQWHRVNMN